MTAPIEHTRPEQHALRGAAALAAVLLGLWGAPAVADTVEQDYHAACDAGVERNNPIWSPAQRRQICACRYAKLRQEFSPQQIASISDALLNHRLGALDERLYEANLRSAHGCAPR